MAIRLGKDARLYRNIALSGMAVMVHVSSVRDVTLGLEAGEADATTRGNNGWRATMATLKDASLEFEMVWDTADANFTAIRNAFLTNTLIKLAVMTDMWAESFNHGLYAHWMITGFSRNEPLEDVITVSVTAKPTYSVNPPLWVDDGNFDLIDW